MANTYGLVGIPDQDLQKEIETEYGSDPDRLSYAQKIAVFAGEFSQIRGGNKDKYSKKTYKRAARRYISERTWNDVQSKEIKPVGFVDGFLFTAILSGIISFFVQRLLKQYFKEEESE